MLTFVLRRSDDDLKKKYFKTEFRIIFMDNILQTKLKPIGDDKLNTNYSLLQSLEVHKSKIVAACKQKTTICFCHFPPHNCIAPKNISQSDI